MPKKLLFFLIFFVIWGCYQTNNDADLTTNPITINPKTNPKNEAFLPNNLLN